jgi:hypothetical protein
MLIPACKVYVFSDFFSLACRRAQILQISWRRYAMIIEMISIVKKKKLVTVGFSPFSMTAI